MCELCIFDPGVCRAVESHILVHQAGFAHPAVAEDDDLHRVSQPFRAMARSCSTLRRTFFRDAMVCSARLWCREAVVGGSLVLVYEITGGARNAGGR